MHTKRTLENLAGLNKKVRNVFEGFLAEIPKVVPENVRVEVISGLRSWHQQAALYAQGRTKPGKIVTNARAGSSWHNYGCAIDLGLFRDGVYLDEKSPREADKIYAKIGELAKRMGIEAAMYWKSFPETPHFQATFGNTLAQLRGKMPMVGFDVNKLF